MSFLSKLTEKIPARGRVVFAHDLFMAGLAFMVAIYLRVGDNWLTYGSDLVFEATGLFVVICGLVFWQMGLYRGVWRYASLNDLVAITKAVTIAILVFLMVAFVWTRLQFFPRSLPFLLWLVLIALLGGPRFLYRIFKDKRLGLPTLESGSQIPVLLVGAGDGAELFIRSLSHTNDAGYRVVGILATTPNRIGRRIHGIEVDGGMDDMETIVARLEAAGDKPQRLLITKENLDGAVIAELLDRADKLGLTLARLPRLTDFKAGVTDKLEIRPIAVEDLLGRPQAALDRDRIRTLIKGRRVLVTGAGGSIGSELVRQVAALGPADLTLVDSSEFALYSIDLELAEWDHSPTRRAVIADVRDFARLKALFEETRPEIIFHAAALKHVPLVEANPFEGLQTNVLGTANVARVARDCGVSAMVMISTDKAVNPTNIMGTSKRIAEMVCQANDLERTGGEAETRFVTVRFGNVLGSTGSVVPLFQRQLARGGPITVTHAEMKRYFMTIREAVELVLQASAHAQVEDSAGKIHVLDMGEPVKILDLAHQMVRLAGLAPDKDIEIKITGLRPGEKLFEEIFHGGEALADSGAAGVFVASPRALDRASLESALSDLEQACRLRDTTAVKGILHQLVPEYSANPEDKPLN
ncbi:MAG: polysaccharide biosynthesis protein [Magnetovibrionaceae bacterium]